MRHFHVQIEIVLCTLLFASVHADAQLHQTLKLTNPHAAANDGFGWSVGVSGTTAVIGTTTDADAGPESASVVNNVLEPAGGTQNNLSVVENDEETVKWLRKAAEQGDADAQHKLGLIYHRGIRLPQDFRAGAQWIERAAVQGHADAQNDLGAFYQSGRGVPVDYQKAAVFFGLAAQQGNGWSQLNLGGLFINGDGVKRDYVQAAYWFTKASRNADPAVAKEGQSWSVRLKNQASLREKNNPDDIRAALTLFVIALALSGALSGDSGDGGTAPAPGLPPWKPYDPCSGFAAVLPACGG